LSFTREEVKKHYLKARVEMKKNIVILNSGLPIDEMELED
jgi:hypothetical protein